MDDHTCIYTTFPYGFLRSNTSVGTGGISMSASTERGTNPTVKDFSKIVNLLYIKINNFRNIYCVLFHSCLLEHNYSCASSFVCLCC